MRVYVHVCVCDHQLLESISRAILICTVGNHMYWKLNMGVRGGLSEEGESGVRRGGEKVCVRGGEGVKREIYLCLQFHAPFSPVL